MVKDGKTQIKTVMETIIIVISIFSIIMLAAALILWIVSIVRMMRYRKTAEELWDRHERARRNWTVELMKEDRPLNPLDHEQTK
jgi:hypothetical protein